MKTLVVRKIKLKPDYEPLELHHIQFPEFKEKGWYRMMISYGAFFGSIKQRYKIDNFMYHLQHEDELTTSILEYFKNQDKNLPIIKHNSLYDFFDYIGYCRKKKKILK